MAEIDKHTDRRRLLRRAGTLAAGVAGAGVASAVAADPAHADDGQPVLQGRPNNAQNTTRLTIHSPNTATLELSNTFEELGGPGAGPALRLVPLGERLYQDSPAGSLSADRLGIPWVSVQYPGFTISHRVHTDFDSNTTVPIIPTRVVDTRTGAGRVRILNPAPLDSAGRLMKARTMHVDLSEFAFFPDAVLLNATVTGQVSAGYLTVFGYGSPIPSVSSLNYAPQQTLSNFVFSVSGDGGDGTQPVYAAISVYTSQLTHVVLDVVGFVTSGGTVNPAVLPTALARADGGAPTGAAARRAEAIRRYKPPWE